jgi:hypothetical protein
MTEHIWGRDMPSDAAAWVQAVGSVLAIVISGRLVEKTARQARLEKLYGADGIFLLTAKTLDEAAEAVGSANVAPGPLNKFEEHRLQDCSRMLDLIFDDLVVIGSERLPRMTSDAQAAVRSSIGALATAKIAIGTTGNIIACRDVLQKDAKKLNELRADVRSFASKQEKRVAFWMVPFM